MGAGMKSEKLIPELKRRHNLSSDKEVASYLGMTEVNLFNWRKQQTPLTARQIANAIAGASKAAIKKSQNNMIRPIVEFFPVTSVESRGGATFELFPAGKEDNPLHRGLREKLGQSNGIYIFYDTRGRAIYAGKAKRQNLWSEMKSAFNRERDTQTVYRVKHPERRQKFVPAHEHSRQQTRTQLQLNKLAAYFSAFEIDPEMIDDLEALIVRAFANDLLNAHMEKFSIVKGAAKK